MDSHRKMEKAKYIHNFFSIRALTLKVTKF